jgi:hypothetical protein
MPPICADRETVEGKRCGERYIHACGFRSGGSPRGLQDFYSNKTGDYFEGLRADIWAALPVLIMSEVLEHLVDPWGVLAALMPRMRLGAQVFASSPNVSHKGVVRALLSGRFDYQSFGVMDRTHLRWFTPATYAEMFEQAGFHTLSVGPLSPIEGKARVINGATGGRFPHLFAVQIMYKGMRPERA